MTDSESECGLFKLVSYQKSAKKPRTEQEERSEVEHQFETSIRIVFKKPATHGTNIHVAANVKEFITTMMKHDPALSILSFDHAVAYHPNNDEFPKKEDEFKKFFLIHHQPTQSALRNHVTVGCIVRTSKTVKDIKFNKTDEGPFVDWLDKHKIFIEINTLGYKSTRVVGYLLRLHPNITHRDSLKDMLAEHL